MAKKITFINPRDFCKFIPKTPYPPLGIGYLSSILKRRNFKVDLIDGQILTFQEYKKRIREINNEIICISATLKQLKEAFRLASFLKKRDSKAIIIIGGAGPSCLPAREILETKLVDFVVKGEAEETLLLLLESLLFTSKSKLRLIPNLAFWDKGMIRETKFSFPPQDLDDIPFPDRNIFPLEAYLDRWKKNTGFTSVSIISSRGCPFSCIFCDKSVSGRR